jgi:hypothetical protein
MFQDRDGRSQFEDTRNVMMEEVEKQGYKLLVGFERAAKYR